MECARMLAPGDVWVWKKVSETIAIKEHGYLRVGDDYI